MTAEPIPLATQLAGLRAAAEAHTGRCWLTRALEAMIMAALARIFGRLEELVRLWQAGLLPALPARDPSRRTPSPAATVQLPTAVSHAASPRPARGRSVSRAPAPASTAMPAAVRRHVHHGRAGGTPDHATGTAPSGTRPPSALARGRPARGPPRCTAGLPRTPAFGAVPARLFHYDIVIK